MSNQQQQQPNTSSRGRGRGRGNGRGGFSTPAPSSTTTSNILVTSGHVEYRQVQSPGVPGGAFSVVVGGSYGVTNVTFHHPIGVTPLSNDEWVATPTEDVAQLLSRKVHPRLEENTRAYETHRLEAAVKAGHLVKQRGSYYLAGETTVTRDSLLATAKEEAKVELASGRNPTAEQIIAKLAENLREKEKKVREYIQSEPVKEAAKLACPLPPYETASGPLYERRQKALPWLKGKNPNEAHDAVLARLFSPFGLEQPAQANNTEAVTTGDSV